MTKENRKRIHLLYGIGVSAMLFIAGLCLITACISIYLSGEQPFSRESVAAAFSAIAVPVWLCVGLVVIGFFLDLFFPKEKEKPAAVIRHSLVLKRLQAKADLSSCEESQRQAVLILRKQRRIHHIICAALLAVGSIVFLCYALQAGSFHPSQINDSMIKAMGVLLPCMAVPFAWAVFTQIRARRSIQQEIALLKQLPTLPAEQRSTPAKRSVHIHLILRSLLLCAGAAILLYGLFTGGTADVLTKAINICTECVGLG